MGLAWRQANSQFQARPATFKLYKDCKDIDEDGTEDPRKANRVEHRMDIKRTGLQNANESEVLKKRFETTLSNSICNF